MITKYKSGIKVFAPASVANVAVGYDILGFPIEGIGDEVIIKKGKQKGLHITGIKKNKGLSKDIQKNTAGFAAMKLLQSLGLEEEPIEMELIKNMEIGTGLGSSAASAVAGVFGVNTYLNSPLTKAEILRFATEGEQIADGSFHADNVAPSLLGGFILIRDNKKLDWTKLPSPVGIKAVVIYPHVKILTKDSRSILSNTVTLETHINQSGNLASFVAALYKSDLELMRRSLVDLIIEPQRAKLIPHFYDIKEIALNETALGFSISGAGPSMFALCTNSFIAGNIIEKVESFYADKKIEVTCYLSNINHEGAKLY